MPAKYTGLNVGGVEIQLTATELKVLGKYVEELKKVKTLKEGIRKLDKIRKQVIKDDEEAGKAETKAAEKRAETLRDIVKTMKYIQTFRSALQASIPNIEEKQVKEQEKEVTMLDLIKKKYAFQLLYFGALAMLIHETLSNSKILNVFFDIIGSALGFILDMLLVSLIPAIVWFVTWLFDIGQWFSTFPDWAKIATLALLTFFSTIGALLFYGVLKTIVAEIVKIGAESVIAKAAVKGIGDAVAGLGSGAVFTLSVKVIGLELLQALLVYGGAYAGPIGAGIADILDPNKTGMIDTTNQTQMSAYRTSPGFEPGQAGAAQNRFSSSSPTIVNVWINGILGRQDSIQVNATRNTT